MRDRLTIGEVAKLTGVTTKTVRHYHKIGLLAEPERSEAGYRLYDAGDLLRLQRIRQLRSFGLSLQQIKTVLGETSNEHSLREALAALLEEVSLEIEKLEDRRRRLESLLSQEDQEISIEPSDKPYAIKLAEEHLGEHLSEISADLWEQEKNMWATLDAFEWPDGYREMQEFITFYYADHPDEYRKMLDISERLAAFAKLPEDSPEVERLAEDLIRHLEHTPFPDGPPEDSPFTSGPMGEVFVEMLNSHFSSAQQRVMELVQKHFDGKSES
ncbi:MAG: MerR family transcriptional regulator [Rubrobacteraceae bacterium]